jgi:hypothetical protein
VQTILDYSIDAESKEDGEKIEPSSSTATYFAKDDAKLLDGVLAYKLEQGYDNSLSA